MTTVKFHNQDSPTTTNEYRDIRAHLPPGSNAPLYSQNSDRWSGSYQPSAFERILHTELQRIKQREGSLKQRIALLSSPNQEQQLELKQQYISIQNAKKLIEIIVSSMEKCMQNISANFR